MKWILLFILFVPAPNYDNTISRSDVIGDWLHWNEYAGSYLYRLHKDGIVEVWGINLPLCYYGKGYWYLDEDNVHITETEFSRDRNYYLDLKLTKIKNKLYAESTNNFIVVHPVKTQTRKLKKPYQWK